MRTVQEISLKMAAQFFPEGVERAHLAQAFEKVSRRVFAEGRKMGPYCKECRKRKAGLKELSESVRFCVGQIDQLMKGPWEDWKGKTLAAFVNKLDMANDSVRYFNLGVDYRKDDKEKYLAVSPK